MNKNKLILPVSIIIGCFILGGFFYLVQLNKQSSIKEQQKLINKEPLLNIIEIEDVAVIKNVKLIYNQSTGELYPILPEKNSVHSCVWTIWGDHGTETVVITKKPFIDSYSDEAIELNNFLPPRVPILVSCVDWQNQVYSGSVNEY